MRKPLILSVTLGLLALSCSRDSGNSYDIGYRMAFEPSGHYIDVQMRYIPSGRAKGTVTFRMPVWAPGYYTVIDYPKYLTGFDARTSSGEKLKWEKSGKDGWVVQKADTVVIEYKVFADAFSVADSRVTEESAFVAPNGVFMYVDVDHPVTLAIDLPEGWEKVSTSLECKDGIYSAPDFDVLYDSPILAGNHLTEYRELDGETYEFAVLTPEGFEESHIADDFLAGVKEAVKIFGDTPYDSYHLLLLGKGYGGLEHQSSQADYTSGTWNFETRDRYLSELRFLTHEYFHNYNVKAIRPVELGPFDYSREVFTPLLWFSEGITCYYESVLLERAGVETEEEHLAFLARYIKETESTEGRKHMSLRQSSYDIWLNFFNRSSNSSDVTISYYVKGPVIGLLTDAWIQASSGGTKSLDDLMNLLYRRYYKEKGRGFTEEEFWASVEEVAGKEAGGIRRYVDTTEEIDYDSILEPAGYHLDRDSWELTRRN